MKKDDVIWEGRETEEWWWGGRDNRFNRINDKDPEDDNVYEPNEYEDKDYYENL